MQKEQTVKMDFVILIVDDSKTIRRVLKRHLSKIGITKVIEADNGKSALTKLYGNNIDMIFADWQMPVMDGLKLLKKVRGNIIFRDIPFYMITAETLTENVFEAIFFDVSGYLMKPFTIDQISEIVNASKQILI